MASTGLQPSLVNTSLLVISIVFPILSTIAVALRFYAKCLVNKISYLDDWVIALVQICAWGVSVNTFVTAGLAGVNHTTLDPYSAEVVFLRALWIACFPFVASLVLVKVAILLFYARIFVTPIFKIAVWIYIAILVAWGIATFVAQLLASRPIPDIWNPSVTNTLRYNYLDFSFAFSIMSIIFDVVVLCFPIPVIRNLQMPQKRKLQVVGIFWLGIFCCIASAVRFRYVYSTIKQGASTEASDRYTMVTRALLWGTAEPNVSIIAACLPTYGPFFISGRGLRSVIDNLKERFSLCSGGSSRSSTQKSTSGVSSSLQIPPCDANDSFPLKSPNQSGQRQRLDSSNHSYHVDIETATSTYSDPASLPMDAHPMRIKVVQDFTQQLETTRSLD